MSISKVNINAKNLNLLPILKALIETGSVTEAAQRLRMSQPNLSRALRLLREEFQDPLFVRTSHGLSPTERARELSIPLQEVVTRIEAVYSKSDFDVKKVNAKFTIATTDYIEFLLAPALSKIVETEAPGVTLNFRPSGGNLPKMQMEGEFDLNVLVVRETLPANYYIQDLFQDPYVCAVRKKHPILSGKPTLERFLEYGHVILNPQGTLWSITDERLQKLKKARRLVLGTPNALSAAAAVAKTDLILTATKVFIEGTMEFLPLEIFKSPFEIESIRVAQVWHERSHADPLHVWMRQKIQSALKPYRENSF